MNEYILLERRGVALGGFRFRESCMPAACALRRMRSLAGVVCFSDGFFCLFLGSVQTREPHDESVDAVLKILVCECDL